MKSARVLSTALAILFAVHGRAAAGLRYEMDRTEQGKPYAIVSGDFGNDDDVDAFYRFLVDNGVLGIVFDSPGGQPYKAMEFGRLIRELDIATMQPRYTECLSACALAFFGGTRRFADSGTIGVHQSSFAEAAPLGRAEAVAGIQLLTADIMDYLDEMGIDPALMQLALRYDSSDMRYLSVGEMAELSVTTPPAPAGGMAAPALEETHVLQPRVDKVSIEPPSAARTARLPETSAAMPMEFTVPDARSGRVRHPKGHAALKSAPDIEAPVLADIANGTSLRIVGGDGRWYRVRAGALTGYMHPSWVYVDQYEAGGFEQALHVQIRSFDNYPDAERFVRSSGIPVIAYLVNNGWYAVVLRDRLEKDRAKVLADYLRKLGKIPGDSFMTYGNTYVRKVCCG